MKYNFLFILLIIFGTSGCGGGGGSSGSGSGSGSNSGGATNAPAPATLQLDPTWTLQSADPTELNLNTSDVDAILNHIFTDQAVQSALLVRNGWVIGERFSPGG